MTRHSSLQLGSIVFDATSETLTPLVVTENDPILPSMMQAALRERVLESPGNLAVGADSDSRCVEVGYITPQSRNQKTYTMPMERLVRPVCSFGEYGFGPEQYVELGVLATLFAVALSEDMWAQFDTIASESRFDDDLVSVARELSEYYK